MQYGKINKVFGKGSEIITEEKIEAYSGSEPYIFVSYAHADKDEVLPVIKVLSDNGFRVWFDYGIEVGTEWPEYIARKLDKAERIIAFMSSTAAESRNCRREINYSLELGKEPIVIYLEDVELSSGLKMQLNTSQAMFKYKSESNSAFITELIGADLLQCCRSTSEPTPAVTKEACFSRLKELSLQPHFRVERFDIRLRRSVIKEYGEIAEDLRSFPPNPMTAQFISSCDKKVKAAKEAAAKMRRAYYQKYPELSDMYYFALEHKQDTIPVKRRVNAALIVLTVIFAVAALALTAIQFIGGYFSLWLSVPAAAFITTVCIMVPRIKRHIEAVKTFNYRVDRLKADVAQRDRFIEVIYSTQTMSQFIDENFADTLKVYGGYIE